MPPRVRHGLLAVLAVAVLTTGVSAADEPGFLADKLRPLFKDYCLKCHAGAKAEADLALDRFPATALAPADRDTWERVARMLQAHEMPPEGQAKPPEDRRQAVIAWLNDGLNKLENRGPADPGRVTLRRLNRVEYANTVRDLLGVEFYAADDFPADDVGYGFDNIGDVLTLSPLLLEKYLDAAEKISRQVAADDAARRRIAAPAEGQKMPSADAAKKILRALVSRAYRRPATDEEVGRLVGLVTMAEKEGQSFEDGLRLALEAILVSPQFLFRVEPEPGPGDKDGIRVLGEYELATRISYFLWSSMPDEALFDAARQGQLRTNLEAQVRRMLTDAKSRALVENFGDQWLQLRNLEAVSPDKKLFSAFDDDLRKDMLTEARRFLEAIQREDRSLLDLLDADFTFVNARLARHYGIPGVEGDDFRRVSLAGTPRGGVMTMAGVLTVTSNPTRTSPVKRGRWVLDNILAQPPGDPPPGVPKLPEDRQSRLSASLRQRMEQHRADPNCAVCHATMDALGFALENFDAVGGWRTKDGAFDIDASGKLPDGTSFNGAAELRAVLSKNRKEQFVHAIVEKLLTYALGRGLERSDRATVDQIVRALAAQDYRYSAAILEIIKSDPFQKRRGERNSS